MLFFAPMLLGAHLIFSAYGFWLPNDPSGSWSDFVASWELLRFGKATKVSTTRSVAHVSHDAALRKAAKKSLNHFEIRFNGAQARETTTCRIARLKSNRYELFVQAHEME